MLPRLLQQAADEAGGEARMIDVRVPRHEHDVGLGPAAHVHFGAGGREEEGDGHGASLVEGARGMADAEISQAEWAARQRLAIC